MQQQEYDTGADMTTKSAKHSHRHLARLALLLLVVIPFVPEIVITATAGLARLTGCLPDQKEPCGIGPPAVSAVIDWGLHAGAGARVAVSIASLTGFYLAIIGWLAMCYVVLTLGWARLTSRLLLGLAVALVFALLPYFGPWLSIANLVTKHSCDPNSGHACIIFGGEVKEAYAAIRVIAPELLYGGVLTMGIFLIYAICAIVAAVTGATSARRRVQADQQNA
jgi:hypothetical protein